jgi:hypothetical protein
MNKRKSTYPKSGNRELAVAMQELRRSNATRPKPIKTERKQRSRSGARRAAIKSAW